MQERPALPRYSAPEAVLSDIVSEYCLASSYNGDNSTEYLEYEDGGLL